MRTAILSQQHTVPALRCQMAYWLPSAGASCKLKQQCTPNTPRACSQVVRRVKFLKVVLVAVQVVVHQVLHPLNVLGCSGAAGGHGRKGTSASGRDGHRCAGARHQQACHGAAVFAAGSWAQMWWAALRWVLQKVSSRNAAPNSLAAGSCSTHLASVAAASLPTAPPRPRAALTLHRVVVQQAQQLLQAHNVLAMPRNALLHVHHPRRRLLALLDGGRRLRLRLKLLDLATGGAGGGAD